MDEDWRNAFGIMTCTKICDGDGAGICDDTSLTCSSFVCVEVLRPSQPCGVMWGTVSLRAEHVSFFFLFFCYFGSFSRI